MHCDYRRTVPLWVLSSLLLAQSAYPAPQQSQQPSSWRLAGCFGTVGDLPPPLPVSPFPGDVTVQSCVEVCSRRNITYALIFTDKCACLNPDEVIRSYVAVNPVECNMKCENDLPCGNELLHRYSAYNTGYGPGGSGVFPSIPSATSSISPSPTTVNGTQPPTEPPASAIISNPKQNNTAMIIALSASAGVAVVGAVAFAVHRLRKRRELHTLPRLTAGVDRKMSSLGQNLSTSQHTIRPSASASQIAVTSLNGFQGMLPLTPNMIYSVTVAYTPSGEQLDEIHVKKDDVVAIQRHFDDGWAIGTNVSTGETGAFPLGCLVMDEAWILAGFVPPVRLRSIGESSGNVGNLEAVVPRRAEGP